MLLGSPPRAPEYDRCFPWPDATIEIPFEAHHLREIIADLDAQPERIATVRMNNIVQTLRTLDWVNWWAQILDQAGCPSLSGCATGSPHWSGSRTWRRSATPPRRATGSH